MNQLEKMFKAHAAIKAKRAVLKAEFDKADGDLKAKMDTIEVGFLKMMNDTGTDQLKVKGVGMCYLSQRVLPICKDWSALWTHVQESGNFDLLQKRLASGGVADYMETHDGNTPPGVTTTIERGVSVRRQS
jgi:hypothetical protein